MVDCENGNSCDFYKSDSMALDGADNRIICHLEEQMKLGITKVMVRTVDSDVIILLLAFMPQFISINKNVDLFCDFGTGESRKMIIINPLFEYLGEVVCLGLLFFIALLAVTPPHHFMASLKPNGLIYGCRAQCGMK